MEGTTRSLATPERQEKKDHQQDRTGYATSKKRVGRRMFWRMKKIHHLGFSQPRGIQCYSCEKNVGVNDTTLLKESGICAEFLRDLPEDTVKRKMFTNNALFQDDVIVL
ncbi:hypothetical protein ANCCAN_11697 [Ancylostoma caninum]|uniref:Uncharacterized protein n=1 Tax=Ancylostoma caninum TaxID=29170 RepID=A0A368GD45_ANCCA|nr:hypothetical protein ANCCAN_11697 [Ancylostoma caninum]